VKLLDVKLAYSARPRSAACAVQVPSVENSELLGMMLEHNKCADRTPPGRSLFALYSDTSVWDRFASLTDEAVIQWGRTQVESLFPELGDQFEFGDVKRYPQAAYLATPGFYIRVNDFLGRLNPASRVQLAGDVFGAGSMEAAAVWGERAAVRALASSERSRSLG
jgi:hypothetical protein